MGHYATASLSPTKMLTGKGRREREREREREEEEVSAHVSFFFFFFFQIEILANVNSKRNFSLIYNRKKNSKKVLCLLKNIQISLRKKKHSAHGGRWAWS
jgi:site-specific DNA-adenine methylase